MTPPPPPARRIAWAGPWNARSAIAAFGSLVVAELAARGHEVEVFRTETGEFLALPPRPAPGPVSPLREAVPEVLARDYDAFVVNIGDHHGHHGAAVAPLLRVPALAIFHDAFLAHLYAGWAEAEGRHSVHPAVLGAVYGPAEAEAAGPLMLPLEEMAARRPMLEWFAALAAGAVVHANHYAERTRSACPGPVDVIPLAFEGFAPPPPREIGPEDQIVVATVGHINRNKRVADMLRAMAESEPLQRRVRYRLIGPVELAERAALVELAGSLGVPEPDFTGWVDDAEMQRQLAAVDVLCCLRNPVLEGASASLILAMRSGRPELVSDHGPYADVPDGLVLKCRPGSEAVDVRLHLEALLADPGPARAMAERARAYAEEAFSAGRYADRLLAHLDRVTETLPVVRAGRGLGRTLAGFGMPPDDPAGGRVAAALDDLLDRRG
ncbi:MAG: glycosyltransferase [Acetobacteraceae bacterium]|nr:glycosyltransferase [Acetobacteraceae bacterium]